MKIKQMMYITMMISISILFHIIESMIPLPLPIPGFKIGLANIVGLVALYTFQYKIMLLINVLRLILGSLLRGGLFTPGFWLAFTGILFSSIAIFIASRINKMSIFGISCVASSFHTIGQFVAVSIIYQQWLMITLLPLLLLLSLPTGLLTATIAHQVCLRINVRR